MGDFTVSGGGELVAAGLGDHWTDLADLTASVRNVLARPGTFADLFPETTDDDLVQLLQDGLAECHLEQILLAHEADPNALVRPQLTSGQGALVVLFAGLRMMRGELLNRVTSAKYVAGPVSADTTYATNVLRDVMKALQAQKDALVASLSAGQSVAAGSFTMADQYLPNLWPSRYAGSDVLVALGWP